MPLPKPPEDSIIHRDRTLTVCLASHPIVAGHTVVVWNKPVRDLHLLSRPQYERLMDAVDDVRDALIKTLKVRKVYLLYMDEANHVHWHLIPRYDVKGFTLLAHKPARLRDFSLAKKVRAKLIIRK